MNAQGGSRRLTVVWHAEGLWEQDWIRFLFEDVVRDEVFDPDFAQVLSGIHVTGSPLRPGLAEYFRRCSAGPEPCYLFHVGDEWFAGDYSVYGCFDGVLRNFFTPLASGPGILTVPMGYYIGTIVEAWTRPANDRKYLWSFLGEIKGSRKNMLDALAGLEPHFVSPARVNTANGKRSTMQFDAIMRDTIFAPCPMGTVILETGRLYESLEYGCIPIVERRAFLDYFKELFGPHPLQTFNSWDDARNFISELSVDLERAQNLQAEIRDWWLSKRKKIQREVDTFVKGPSYRSHLVEFAASPRNSVRPLFAVRRMIDLARHQSARAPRPIKRILMECLGCGTIR